MLLFLKSFKCSLGLSTWIYIPFESFTNCLIWGIFLNPSKSFFLLNGANNNMYVIEVLGLNMIIYMMTVLTVISTE